MKGVVIFGHPNIIRVQKNIKLKLPMYILQELIRVKTVSVICLSLCVILVIVVY